MNILNLQTGEPFDPAPRLHHKDALVGPSSAGFARRNLVGMMGVMMSIGNGDDMVLNGLFGGVPYTENNIEIVDNSSTIVSKRCSIFCKKITATEVLSLNAAYCFGIESADKPYDALIEVSLPKCTSMKNRSFFYRSRLETIRLPALNSVTDCTYWFYGCNALTNVYMTAMQSATAIASGTAAGGFPWGAPNTCVFHFADGDYYGNGNAV